MKKIVTILMLVAVLFATGASVDAKTTKKKAKARTSQTSSGSKYWNGDMPTAKLVLDFSGIGGEDTYGFAQKGYRIIDGEVDPAWFKDGVCKIENWGGSGGGETTISVYNSSKLNQLYNDIKKAAKGYEVTKKGNTITIFW